MQPTPSQSRISFPFSSSSRAQTSQTESASWAAHSARDTAGTAAAAGVNSDVAFSLPLSRGMLEPLALELPPPPTRAAALLLPAARLEEAALAELTLEGGTRFPIPSFISSW